MTALADILGQPQLRILREAYDPSAMISANANTIGAMAPRFAQWNDAVAATFYDPKGPVAPQNRERCLIVMLVCAGRPTPLAVHVYWGLMEGIEPEEIVHLVGLASCYGGLPNVAFGLEAVNRIFQTLANVVATLPAGTRPVPSVVFAAMVREFAPAISKA